jgi:hypothetical protein
VIHVYTIRSRITSHPIISTGYNFAAQRKIDVPYGQQEIVGRLVNVESLDFVVGLAKSLVFPHENNLGNPCEYKSSDGESSRGAESDDVTGAIGLGPEVRGPEDTISNFSDVM